jgi:hypothetical protein
VNPADRQRERRAVRRRIMLLLDQRRRERQPSDGTRFIQASIVRKGRMPTDS